MQATSDYDLCENAGENTINVFVFENNCFVLRSIPNKVKMLKLFCGGALRMITLDETFVLICREAADTCGLSITAEVTGDESTRIFGKFLIVRRNGEFLESVQKDDLSKVESLVEPKLYYGPQQVFWA